MYKYDSSGNYIWAKSIGSYSDDIGNSIAVDPTSGEVLVSGYFEGTADFDPGADTTNLVSAGGRDIFIARYDSFGNYLWAKALGGNLNDNSLSITMYPASGGVLVTGYFTDIVDFDPGTDTANLISAGYIDIFIAKYDVSGNYLWAKNISGTLWEAGYSIAVDITSGGVLVTGYFTDTVDFDPGADTANLVSAGNRDIFIARYDSSGNYLWAKRMGGTLDEFSYSIAADPFSGGAMITGQFEGAVDFDPGPGTANLVNVGSPDIFIAKYDSLGNYLWAKALGSTSHDYGYSITMDPVSGMVLVTGFFGNTADFDPGPGTANLTSAGDRDIFVAKYYDCSNNPPIAIISSVTNITCNGESDGSAIVTANGGTAPYSYLWSNSATADSVNGLAIGPYQVSVIDANGCVATASATITQPAPTTAEICLITVDSTSAKNIVVWEKPTNAPIDSFLIYRDVIGTYKKAGAVAYEDLSKFTDTTQGVNPNSTAYKYKISVFDICGNESPLSDYHKTIHLQMSSQVNLSWTDYEGFTFTYYRILRDTAGNGNWVAVDSTAAGTTTWTDINPPAYMVNNRYLVEVVSPDMCTVSKAAANYNSSHSNIRFSMPQGTAENPKDKAVLIFPNPNDGTFVISYSSLVVGSVKIYNLLGEIVFSTMLNSPTSILNTQLPNGVYYIQLQTEQGMAGKKMIINQNSL